MNSLHSRASLPRKAPLVASRRPSRQPARAPSRGAPHPSPRRTPGKGRPAHTAHRMVPRPAVHRMVPRPTAITPTGTPPSSDVVRIVPLGGFEEIGRNMMTLECGEDIIIIDMGLQFPEEGTPGIDYIIPNITYLKDKIKRIRGVFITHGHYDHIGAVPHLIGHLGNPPIFASAITAAIIQKRQTDFPTMPRPAIEIITPQSVTRFGNFTIRYFPVAHNIPEGVGLAIETPVGLIVHPGEFKFLYDRNREPVGIDAFKELGSKNVHLLMLDSTKAEGPDTPSIPEWEVEENITELLKQAEGRVIISTFASLLDRLIQIIHIAHGIGRKIAITGYSMKTNFEIARELGLIKAPQGAIIPIEHIDRYNDRDVLILTTGAQGEERSGLSRMANASHRNVKIRTGDTVIFSSSIVPGNERAVQLLRDNLSRQGATVYHYQLLDIHSGGHATRKELRETIQMVKPKFFLPIHGHYFMRVINAKLARETLGIPENHTVIGDNGQVVEVRRDGIRLLEEKVPTSYVMVDGLGVGDVGDVVLRDRLAMAQDGIFMIILAMDPHNGQLLSSPDIISRGFVYMKESQALIHQARKKVRDIAAAAKPPHGHDVDAAALKNTIRKELGQFLFQKTERRPMILPVIIEL